MRDGLAGLCTEFKEIQPYSNKKHTLGDVI